MPLLASPLKKTPQSVGHLSALEAVMKSPSLKAAAAQCCAKVRLRLTKLEKEV